MMTVAIRRCFSVSDKSNNRVMQVVWSNDASCHGQGHSHSPCHSYGNGNKNSTGRLLLVLMMLWMLLLSSFSPQAFYCCYYHLPVLFSSSRV